MRDVVIIAIFVGLVVWVCKATAAPVVAQAATSWVPSVGATAGDNTLPGQAGAMYVPVPGSPGLVMRVNYSGFNG
jgi:hypothetical protein